MADGGLTDFGRAAIEEMNRVGMVVCCSHTGPRTAFDTIKYSKQPVIFSHSNARAVFEHPRNISDELMLACANKGGVVGINGVGLFLGQSRNLPQAVARHVDYAVNVVGWEHVALGLDYVFDQRELDEYVGTMAETFPSQFGYSEGMALLPPDGIPQIVEELLEMGHSARTIKAVLGRNWLRVAQQVWR